MSDEHKVEYEVDFYATLRKTVKVRAASPEAAFRLAEADRAGIRDGYPIHWRADYVTDVGQEEDFAVWGHCEECGVVLLEGRDQGKSVDEDGTQLCTPCCKQAVEDSGADRAGGVE